MGRAAEVFAEQAAQVLVEEPAGVQPEDQQDVQQRLGARVGQAQPGRAGARRAGVKPRWGVSRGSWTELRERRLRDEPGSVLGQGQEPIMGIWPVFRDDNEPLQVARRTRLRSNGKVARPYICRLIILVRLTLPSTTPELHGMVRPLSTAS